MNGIPLKKPKSRSYVTDRWARTVTSITRGLLMGEKVNEYGRFRAVTVL